MTRPTRRQVVQMGAGLVGAVAATGLYTWQIEPHWVEVTEVPMPLPGLDRALVGKTLVQLSDIHVGADVSRQYQLDSLDRVNALRPDIVVMTGDFMSCQGDEYVEATAHVLRRLKTPPMGKFVSLGNHDYGVHWKQLPVADALEDALTRLGYQVLRNQAVSIGNMTLVGLDDLWSPRFDTAVLREVAQRGPTITLCHNPDGSETPGWDGVDGWVLSGHTHGGQVKPPFLPPPYIPVRNKRFTAGSFEMTGGRTLYINRGLGHQMQARFNARPEITRFTLLRA